MAQNNRAIQRPSDAASHHSARQDSGLDVAATAWEARSSTETAPAQRAGEAHNFAINDASRASQVGSDRAAHDDAHTQRDMTQEQLLAQLDSYYTDRDVMSPAVVLACVQVLPVTVMIFNSIAVEKVNATNLIIRFMTSIFVVQPINSFLAVLWGLTGRIEMVVPVVDGAGSRYQRHRWWARWPTIRSCLIGLLFAIDLVCLVLADTITEVSISCSILVVSYLFVVLHIWYAMRVSQRVEVQTRTDTLAVAEAGHELEAVA